MKYTSVYSHRTPTGQSKGWNPEEKAAEEAYLANKKPSPTEQIQRPLQLTPSGRSPPFNALCGLYHDLAKTVAGRSKINKSDRLRGFYATWRDRYGLDLYPLIRLLIPLRDRERPVYGLKEQSIAKIYLKVIHLDDKTPTGLKLMKWKVPTAGQEQSAGDFATVVYNIIKDRSEVAFHRPDVVTVDYVNEVLDLIAAARGSMAEVTKIWDEKIFGQMTPMEQKWLIRIILKDMKIGATETTVLKAFHSQAVKKFGLCSDLKLVCWELWDEKINLKQEDMKISLMTAFRPMLSRRTNADYDHTYSTIGKQEFFIEEKLDGERIQLHKKGNQYMYFSRNAKDYTYLYGSDQQTGALSPLIHGAFKEETEECVLDGEMVVYDPENKRYLPFGNLKTAALEKSGDPSAPHPCFKVFDIVYYKSNLNPSGSDVTGQTLEWRKNFLPKVFHPIEHQFEIVEFVKGNSAKEIKEKLEVVMENKGEGLILKRPSSTYIIDGRTSAWCKVKPDYIDEFGENCDLMVLGAWYGTGGRGGRVSSLLCGLRTDQMDDNGTPIFGSFVKVGSGMNIDDYTWIQKWHKDHFRKFNRDRPPSFMKLGKGIEDKPDLWIHPNESFVVSVKAAEIIDSEEFHFGQTLRFPRCKRVRWDHATVSKMSQDHAVERSEEDHWDMNETLSYDDWRAFASEEKGKRLMEEEEAKSPKKKVKRTNASSVPRSFNPDLSQVIVSENVIFQGLTFVVPSNSKKYKKAEDIKKLLKEHGGTIRAAAPKIAPDDGDSRIIIVAAQDKRKFPSVKPYLDDGPYDVVDPDWIDLCLTHGRLLPLFEKYMLYAVPSTQNSAHFHSDPNHYCLVHMGRLGVEPNSDDDETISNSSETQISAFQKEIKEENAAFEKDPDLWLPASTAEGSSMRSDWRREREELVEEMNTDDEMDMVERKNKAGLDDDFKEMGTQTQDEQITMGDPEANSYDEEHIFQHLVFYLDTAANADENDLTPIHDEPEETTDRAIANDITAAGGVVASDLYGNLKITHIITDDTCKRYNALIKAVKNKRRQIVTYEWISVCATEKILVPEEEYRPL